jgi:hypothetical protein
MSQAPPSVAPTGEDAIYRTIDAAPESFTDEASVSLDEAYEVQLTLDEINKGGYQRVSSSTILLQENKADQEGRTTDRTSVRG